MTNTITSKQYAGLVGLGLLYIWGAAIMAWLDLWQSQHAGMRVGAFLGMGLTSASGIAIAFYTSGLEIKLEQLAEKNQISQSEAEYWKDQAQVSLACLEKERRAQGVK